MQTMHTVFCYFEYCNNEYYFFLLFIPALKRMRTAVESSLKAFTIKVKLICVDCTCVLIIFSQIWSHFFRCHFWKVFQFPFFPDFPDILKISSDLIVHLIIFSHMISYHIIFWKIIQFLNIFSKILEKVPVPVSGTVWKLTFSSFRNNMLQNLFHLAFWENQSWLSFIKQISASKSYTEMKIFR